MNQERANIYYSQLKHYFLKTDSDCTDKARSFRTIIHEFYNELTMSDGTFAEALHQFYKSGHDKTVADFAFKLKDTLNEIVHHNDRISKEKLCTLYESCVRLIYLASGALPDSETLALIGVKETDQFSGLNHQQKDAIKCEEQIIYVNAGPGTGKTTLLVNKILQYIISSTYRERIVALSYTNTAARELGQRFRKKVFEAKVNKPYDFYNGTLHAFCFKLMLTFHELQHKDFNYIIVDDNDIAELAEELRIQLDNRFPLKAIMECLKSGLNSKDPALGRIIDEIKKTYRIMSIDDILLMFIDILSKDATFKKWVKEQISIIVIDEAQDLSAQNYRIFKMLLNLIPNLKLFIVGDPRQNIYGFNGGSYEHLNGFLSGCGRYAEKTLSITYRCPESICRYVNTFTFTDCRNVPLVSEAKNDGKISVHGFCEYEHEIDFLLEEIQSDDNHQNTAILCQSLKYLMPVMEELCRQRVPYKVFGGRKAIKPHIKVLNHILRILSNENEYSIKCIAKEFRYDLSQLAARLGCTRKQAFFITPLGLKIKTIREEKSRLDMDFPAVLSLVMEEITINIPEDQNQEDFHILAESTRTYKTIEDYLLAFAIDKDTFELFYEKDYLEYPHNIEGSCLTISTIHSAKGLEWNYVYIAGVNEGNLPNEYFVRDLSADKQRAFFNECKKIMYVAATRSKNNLHISYSMENQSGYPAGPSRYISDILYLEG